MAVTVLTAAALAGCSSGDDDSGDAAPAPVETEAAESSTQASGGGLAAAAQTEDVSSAPSTAAPGEPSADGGQGEQSGSPGVDVPALQQGDYGRDVIYTATIDVAVADVGTAARDALTAVQSLGGILYGQDTTSDPEPQSRLVFKVLPQTFTEVLARLGELGTVLDQNVAAEDVTAVVIDLESRIRTAELSVDRLRGFLADADDLATIAQLEDQLLQRETQLEQLRGQLRVVQDQVDLATVTLVLTEAPRLVPEADIEVVVAAVAGHDAACPQAADAEDEIELDEGEELSLCYLVSNDGETSLSELQVVDHGLDIDTGDLRVVSGDLDEPLAPDAQVVLRYETVLDRDRESDAEASGLPVDDSGAPLGDRVTDRASVRLQVDDGGIPGFGDAVSSSTRALGTVASVIVLVLGVLLPFAPFILAAAALWWFRRRTALRHHPQSTS